MWLRLLGLSVSIIPIAAAVLDDTTTCRAYDPARISMVAPSGGYFATHTWKIESDGAVIEEAANQQDAEKVATLAKFYTGECRIGPPKHLVPPVTFWEGAESLPALAFREDCISYDPSQLEYNNDGYVRDKRTVPKSADVARPQRLFITVPGENQGKAVLALARRATSACVIGGWRPQIPTALEIRARQDAEGRHDMEDAENAWHPVYYWR